MVHHCFHIPVWRVGAIAKNYDQTSYNIHSDINDNISTANDINSANVIQNVTGTTNVIQNDTEVMDRNPPATPQNHSHLITCDDDKDISTFENFRKKHIFNPILSYYNINSFINIK